MNFKKLAISLAATAMTTFGAHTLQASAIQDDHYIVKSGDTLSQIAKDKFNDAKKAKAIAKVNDIKNIHKIYVGQDLDLNKEKVEKVAKTISDDEVETFVANTPIVETDKVATPAPATEVTELVLENEKAETPATPAPAAPTTEETAPVVTPTPEAAKPAVEETATTTPAPEAEPVKEEAPATPAPAAPTPAPAPAKEEAPAPKAATPAQANAAKEWIAQRESNGSYDARNGRYIGRYQLTDSYLNGDYSPENQERVADNYVKTRYGSWEAAKNFWLANGWY